MEIGHQRVYTMTTPLADDQLMEDLPNTEMIHKILFSLFCLFLDSWNRTRVCSSRSRNDNG